MDLSIRGIVKRFGPLTALDSVSLDVPHGTFVCFLGPSGCGKTTLLRVIAGLELADAGEIRLGERDLSRTPARDRNFGVVFQSYSLFPNMSAAKNIAYGLECRGWSKPAIAERVEAMLKLIQLADHAHKLPAQLSGGQQQRVALARAIAPDPSLLLLDEPLSALDAKVREELRTEIRALQRRLGITTIMVTHDQEEAMSMADLVIVMNGGRIEQAGRPVDLYAAPQTTFVANFMGRMNLISVNIAADGRPVFAGMPLTLAGTAQATTRTLGIRPEAVWLLPAGAEGDNIFPATVREVVFLGNITRVAASPDAAPDTRLAIELHGAATAPAIGDAVAVALPAAALRVLT